MDPSPSILPLDRADWRWTFGRIAPSVPGGPLQGTPVTLPHCWTAAEEYIPGLEPRRGWATYQADVELPRLEPGREAWLRCGGFHGHGFAWLNAQPLGAFNADYIGFELDATHAGRAGLNRLVIQVCNRCSPDILPGLPDPDFHLYGGLGGELQWISRPEVRLDRDGCRILFDDARPESLTVEIGMENRSGQTARRSLRITVRNPAGGIAAAPDPQELAIPARGAIRTAIPCTLPTAQMWSPDAPNLYSVEVSLGADAPGHDRLEWSFGLRTVRFDPQAGLLINGQPVVLRGVNRHENVPGFGSALPRALHLADARRIKDLGLNFVRLSHYPQSPAFLDACDRLGILVYAELCSWKRIRDGRWATAAESQLARMIRRDRHHPAVLLWGLGNEGRHRATFLRLKQLARDLDPARATIYAENHAYRARRQQTAGLTDVWGLNYEFDALDAARAAAPTGCVLATECANLPYARRGHWPAEAQQTALIQDAVRRMESAGPGAIGWALWCFADYATPRRQRWFRECGILDGWRRTKMAADWVQARFGNRPVLSVRGDWSHDAGPLRRIFLVTNCPDVQILHADGSRESLASETPGLYDIDLPFDGGPVRFHGSFQGQAVETRLVPWGPAAGFMLHAEPLPSPSDDDPPVLQCTLQVLDADGHPVLGYEGEAHIRLPDGIRASLIGGNRIPVHAGQAAFFVEAPRGETHVPLHATLDDLPPRSIELFNP
jgi:beta-galactosidase